MHATLGPPAELPFYFPLTPDYATGQADPKELTLDQYGNGALDGFVFQFTADAPECLRFKRELLAEHEACHVGRSQLSDQAEATVCSFIADRLMLEYPDRFNAAELHGLSFDELAMRVCEDLAITCVQFDEDGKAGMDWLAAAHVCTPSGWNPREMLGRSFAQVHRTVQIDSAKRFLVEDGKLKDYVGQMMGCEQPHVRFIWTVQCGDALNRNPQTRGPVATFERDPATGRTNACFRVERQTITGFADVGASLFTIRTYLYPLDEVVADAARRTALREAIRTMPQRVRKYKSLDGQLIEHILAL